MADNQPTLADVDAPPDAGVPLDDADLEVPPAPGHEPDAVVEIVAPASPGPLEVRGELARQTSVVTGGDLDTARRLAEGLARTEFVPKTMRGNAGAVMACILTGRELGIGPMAALQNIAVIDGRPNLSAKLQAALVRHAGHRIEGTSDATRAEIVGTRGDTGESITVTWTLEDAARAGLATIDDDGRARKRGSSGKPMPWESYTPAMLWARAITELCTRLFSDVVVFGVSDLDPDFDS